ncbi:MAG: radical SAM protein [Candidatus Hydrogenedentes bacterium]|nr:radical SAM protein [Candidatus Hydrogenedentota bacterium]
MSEPPWAEDLFIIPQGEDRYFLYAPLRRQVAVVNGAAAAAVARWQAQGRETLRADELPVLDELQRQGFCTGPAPAPPLFPDDYTFQPHEVTLFLTSRCNLRCRYCYADAGRKSVELAWPAARAAIDLVAVNAGLLGSPVFGVGFHGGGEPTVAWDSLAQCVAYAEAQAERLGLDVSLYAATNGLLSPDKRAFLCEHFDTVNVSLDGPDDIQDWNRPTAGGGGSYAGVAESIRDFEAHGLHYGIRATITARSVHRMSEIVDHICGQFRPAYLHLEPAWSCGRCLTTGEEGPAQAAFLMHYPGAVARGRQHGVAVHYSGARMDTLTSKFCAAPGDSFTVLPEGIVTSCYEVTEPDDPRAAIFHYGKFDEGAGAYVFDAERLRHLRSLSVDHLAYCQDCFCKWHCAGDCLAKVFRASGAPAHRGSERCTLNRALTRVAIEESVAAGSEGGWADA